MLGIQLPCCEEAQAAMWWGFLQEFWLIVSAAVLTNSQHQPQTWKERSLQMVLAPTSPKFSSWVPRYCNAENRCTHHALYQFLIHRIWEHNTMIAVLHPQAWGGLFHGIRQMDTSLAPLLSTVDVGGLFRQERIPLRFQHNCTKKSTLWNHLLIKWTGRPDYSDRSSWAKKGWCSPPLYLCW